jgi:wyosine [tRNA(Phe)-imidazoG37] synthetase (radical SAM superfamily)
MLAAPVRFHDPEVICADAGARLAEARAHSISVDYLTFVPDGEPTLDSALGSEITLLEQYRIPVAVITNGSMLWLAEVREALCRADLVSIKIDTVDEKLWRRVNRPHGSLSLERILGGIRIFAREYQGVLVTETMLVGGINDAPGTVEATAGFLQQIAPERAFISTPIRPPVESRFRVPSPAVLERALGVFSGMLDCIEPLQGYEGDSFASTSVVRDDILGITAVHPMREDAMRFLLSSSGVAWDLVEDMVSAGELVRKRHGGHVFFIRRRG